jgi:transcriptional regulator with AAA-type ATPase domain
MAKVTPSSEPPKKRRPALSPDAREKQVIAAAMDLAEQQILDGTASSQVITHFLKLGSMRERLERERLEEENKLLKAKTEAIKSTKRSEELMEEALAAFRNYSGQGDPDEY